MGRALFRVYGPNEVDDKVEGQEIREALIGWKFIGSEREGLMFDYVLSPIISRCLCRRQSSDYKDP